MTPRTMPPFRADHVGSLIRPDYLLQALDAHKRGALSAHDLRATRERAIRDVVRLQENAGLRSVTDGEFNRTTWQRDFLLKIKNIALVESKIPIRFHSEQGVRDHAPPSLRVVGKLARPREIFVDDYRFLHATTNATGKVTLPSPTVVHFRGGREAVDRDAYPDIDQFYKDLAAVYRSEIADLAAAGCRYLQLDEVNLAYLCDPELRKAVAGFGEDPETLPRTYARLLNDVVRDKPNGFTVAMHLCRGNFAGAWIAEGGYEPIAELLFNEIDVDGYFLEYDSARAGGFEPLRFLPKGKIAVLGLITTKSAVLETKEDLIRRIEQAAKFAPLDQLALSPQCGFSSSVGGETMTVDQERAKLDLIVETATEVWGSV